MIKVCHVTSVHPVFDGRIFHKECCSLAKKYDTFLVAANVENQEVNGVHIRGVALPTTRVKRMLHIRSIIPTLINIDADVYHFHDPELIPIGSYIRRTGKKVVFDSHEDTPLLIKCKLWIPKIFRSGVSWVYFRFEKKHLSRYDAIVSVTPHIVDRLKKINSNTYQITNYQIYSEGEDKRQWQRKVCFAGLLSPNWNFDKIIPALFGTDVSFELAGPSFPDSLKAKLISLKGWENVHYLGQIPHSAVKSLIQQCSVGLALESYDNPNAAYKLGSLGVTKLFEYMAAGVPVICTDLVLWKQVIEEAQCGICVNPYSIEEIKNAINYLLDNPEIAKKMGDNGIKAVREKYNWATQEVELFRMYDKILKA